MNRTKLLLSLYERENLTEVLELFREDYQKAINPKFTRSRRNMEFRELFLKYYLAITYMENTVDIKRNINRFRDIVRSFNSDFDGIMLEFFYIPNFNERVKTSFNIRDEIKRIKSLLSKDMIEDERFYHIFYLVALSTGRKMNEILYTFFIKDSQFRGLLYVPNRTIEAFIISIDEKEINIYLDEIRDYTEKHKDKTFTKNIIQNIKKISRGYFSSCNDIRREYIREGKLSGKTKAELTGFLGS